MRKGLLVLREDKFGVSCFMKSVLQFHENSKFNVAVRGVGIVRVVLISTNGRTERERMWYWLDRSVLNYSFESKS